MYNTIQLKALKSLGYDILFITGEDYMKQTLEELQIRHIGIPQKYYDRKFPRNAFGSVSNKIADIQKLRFALRVARSIEHDAIVFLTYDIVSYFFCPGKGKRTFLVNHNNVEHISGSRYKLFMTRRLPANHIFIAISREMEQKLRVLLPGREVSYIPHGVPDLDAFKAKENPSGRYVLVIADSSCNLSLLKSVVTDPAGLSSFKSAGVSFLAKVREKVAAPDVKYIDRRLTDEEYYSLLCGASVVFLPYDGTFQCRTSGVMHECFALGTPVITSDIPAFQEYKPLVNGFGLVARDAQSFYMLCSQILARTGDESYYRNLETLSPSSYWGKAIN